MIQVLAMSMFSRLHYMQATYMQILKILVFSIISGKQSDMSENYHLEWELNFL